MDHFRLLCCIHHHGSRFLKLFNSSLITSSFDCMQNRSDSSTAMVDCSKSYLVHVDNPPDVVSCMISIASKGMLVENQDQQRFRKLRTGYATSILLIVIITEVLWFLWIEDILQTYLLVVFIPMYIWALFYIVKMILLYKSY